MDLWDLFQETLHMCEAKPIFKIQIGCVEIERQLNTIDLTYAGLLAYFASYSTDGSKHIERIF